METSQTERQIPYDLSYMWNLKQTTKKQNENPRLLKKERNGILLLTVYQHRDWGAEPLWSQKPAYDLQSALWICGFSMSGINQPCHPGIQSTVSHVAFTTEKNPSIGGLSQVKSVLFKGWL